MHANGRDFTLKQIFENSDISTENLTLDSLDVRVQIPHVMTRQATGSHMGFFDKFALTYNPFRCSELRTIFLKKDNFIKGRYFAEICNEVFRCRDTCHVFCVYCVTG